jgi:hypothetical protein
MLMDGAGRAKLLELKQHAISNLGMELKRMNSTTDSRQDNGSQKHAM